MHDKKFITGIRRWERDKPKPTSQKDELVIEEPVEIRVDTQSVCVTMRTPGEDEELAAGFLLSEGLVKRRGDILKIQPLHRDDAGNVIDVFLAPGVVLNLAQLTRHVFASSSCGLCGKATIKAVHQHFSPIKCRWEVPARTLLELPEQLFRSQKCFRRTGGLHAAGIFTRKGKLLVLREDVGRHNAVDKVLGWGLLQNFLPFDRHILVVSGRASFEIMQKALAARLAVVCAISAPSSLAVEFARKSAQTLAGFVREGRMNIYSKPKRVV